MRKSAFPVLLLFFLLSVGIVLISQTQQHLRTRASANTTLALLPSTSYTTPITKRVGDTVSFDVMLYPGTNQLSTVKIHITYDSSIFEVSQKTGFEVNKKAFPFALEGPLVDNNNGSMIATFVIGADPSQIITTPTKIGTLHLIALRETNDTARSKIYFEDTTQAYSIAERDYAYENVIATTSPAYVIVRPKITGASPTKPAAMLTPSSVGSSSSTPASSRLITPTVTPSPTPTPTEAPKAIELSMNVFFSGVGKNPLENPHPKRTTRYAKVFLENAKNLVTRVYDVPLHYEEANTSFAGKLIVPDEEVGTYTIRVKADGYLSNEVSAGKFLAIGDNRLPPVTLTGGDINNDGRINVVDYNLLFMCSDTVIRPPTCNKQTRSLADLDDNGRVDENDQFIFIKQNE